MLISHHDEEKMATGLPLTAFPSTRQHCFTVGHTIFKVDQRYILIRELGKGSYGVVCSGLDRLSGYQKVAIKKINNVFDNLTKAVRTLREMFILKNVKHKNIITLKDIMLPDQKNTFKDVYLVYELMDSDLHQIIGSDQHLSNDHVRYFMFQLLRGLEYLHSSNILHRDLKPGNLLVNKNSELKICDFGLARTTKGKGKDDGEPKTEYVVTRFYRAPELLLYCESYGTPIDIWSAGCVMAELLGREPLFSAAGHLEQLKLIIQFLGTQQDCDTGFISSRRVRKFIKDLPYSSGVNFRELYPGADPLAIDLLQKLLVFDPAKRITAKNALLHPYLLDLSRSILLAPDRGSPMQINISERSGEQLIRDVMWDEMLLFRREAAGQRR